MALEKAKSQAFTIQGKTVEIHYAHYESFIPVYAPTQWTIDYGSEGQLAIYWDEQAYLSVYTSPSSVLRAPPTATSRKYPPPPCAFVLKMFLIFSFSRDSSWNSFQKFPLTIMSLFCCSTFFVTGHTPKSWH